MKDEYEALQITCTSIEDKSKQLQKENDQLVSSNVHVAMLEIRIRTKLASLSLNVVTLLQTINGFPIKILIYSKLVLAIRLYSAKMVHKLVGKWPTTDCYFKLCMYVCT